MTEILPHEPARFAFLVAGCEDYFPESQTMKIAPHAQQMWCDSVNDIWSVLVELANGQRVIIKAKKDRDQ